MKKKVLATVLAGTMAASLLAGCGAKVEDGNCYRNCR